MTRRILVMVTQVISESEWHNTLIYSGANNRWIKSRKTCLTVFYHTVNIWVISRYHTASVSHSHRPETVATQSRSSQSPIEITMHARRTGNLIFPQETKVMSQGRFHPPGPTIPTYSLAWVGEGSSVTSFPCLRAINLCMPAAFFLPY